MTNITVHSNSCIILYNLFLKNQLDITILSCSLFLNKFKDKYLNLKKKKQRLINTDNTSSCAFMNSWIDKIKTHISYISPRYTINSHYMIFI